MPFKRRRRTSITATALIAASLVSIAAGGEADGEQSLRPTAELHLEQENHDVGNAGGDSSTVDLGLEEDDEHDASSLEQQSASHEELHHPNLLKADDHHHHLTFDESKDEIQDESLYRRHLRLTAAQTFANFTPQKIAHAIPLDLKIDTSTGSAYMAGLNGYMQPYATSSFVEEYGDERYWDSILEVGYLMGDVDELHEQSPRQKRTRVDAESYYEPRSSTHGLRGRRMKDGELDGTTRLQKEDGNGERRLKLLEEDKQLVASFAVHLDSIEFKAAGSMLDAHDIYWSQVEEDDDVPIVELIHEVDGEQDDSEEEPTLEHQGEGNRSLQGMTQGSAAQAFINGYTTQDLDESDLDDSDSDAHHMKTRGRQNGNGWRNKNKNNNGGGGGRYSNQGRNKNKNKNKDQNSGNNNKNNNSSGNGGNNKSKKLPQISNVHPSSGDTVQSKQTFSASVSPAQQTSSAISDVRFQLTDHSGSKSDWLTVPRVGNGLYEITVDGFSKYPGTQWGFEIVAEDVRGKKKSTGDTVFKVLGVGGSGSDFANNGGNGNDNRPNFYRPEPAPPAPSPPSSPRPMPKNKVTDSDWNAGGAIQGSTGRILFEFDNSGQTFVCSGIVLCDGPRGQSPNKSNGRAVIQTAAHCAYSDIMKKFATKAIFIPDQDSTRGDKSDFDCENDRYGCWHLSFAVVAEGWTGGSFPTNVDWDYAYYAVIDDPYTHSGGYKPGLTGKLDHDVACVKVDFDTDISRKFVFSIGYSADKDPHLRHCAMENTAINGVPWYTNYWLEDCAMTGGASGGGWIMDMDQDGHGTLISVNSWGFTHKPGMAGPKLSTKSGSWAECLFEKAQRGSDPGNKGGYIIDKC